MRPFGDLEAVVMDHLWAADEPLTVRDVLERGVAAGVFSTPDVRMTALAILSLGIDVARWYRDEGRWTPDEVAAHYRLLALRMVGAA